jgi:signal transduction histidine kinase/CheY-like chemotaxis protein
MPDKFRNSDGGNDLIFKQEWEDILILLIKEQSLDVLLDEILMRIAHISQSSFGAVVLLGQENRSGCITKTYNDDNFPEVQSRIAQEIESNLNYISKWLLINKHSLILSRGDEQSPAYGVLSLFNTSTLIIAPALYKDELTAIFFLAKSEGSYSANETALIEQLSVLLANEIYNSRSRTLSAALQEKVKQMQKLESVGKLAGGMAHDFNNLLSNIFASLSLLKRKLADSPDIFHLLDSIEASSLRARDISKGLLSFGKAVPIKAALINPNEILDELIKVTRQTFPSEIQIESDIPRALGNIYGNSTEIYQVLLNLCINAKEAIKGSGTISISADNFSITDRNIFDYPFLDIGNYVKFSVKDSGQGISQDDMSKIFEPYFSTKQKDYGSGMGLFVAHGIIKAHSGFIDVTSTAGNGARFDIYIPVYEKKGKIKPDRTGKIIMIADDEAMLRDLLAELLESYNYEVIKVSDGNDVIRVLTEEIKVDLLIIDNKMPRMDGGTCIKEIRKLGFDMPVVFSSGAANITPSELHNGSLGNISFLNKPYDFETMLEIIKELL